MVMAPCVVGTLAIKLDPYTKIHGYAVTLGTAKIDHVGWPADRSLLPGVDPGSELQTCYR